MDFEAKKEFVIEIDNIDFAIGFCGFDFGLLFQFKIPFSSD